MISRIAIVGMACRYPDAADPSQLWENVLAGRRALRRVPGERIGQPDDWSPAAVGPDPHCPPLAALLEPARIDCAHFVMPEGTSAVAALTGRLALDTAARALADAGFPGGAGLPRARAGVVIGHPPLAAAPLHGPLPDSVARLVRREFGLGFDEGCPSSLLAVVRACAGLTAGQLDVALAGGVDLRTEPSDLVGPALGGGARTAGQATAPEHGWPGDGCGVLVLMRQEDAEALRLRSYAAIAGWGIAFDDRADATGRRFRGFQLALERAYNLAGFDISTVGYFEGHRAVLGAGREDELRVLRQARRRVGDAPPAVAGTVEANIGHARAAAGAAGTIMAALALQHQVIPPTASYVGGRPGLAVREATLQIARTAGPWPAGRPIRAGVSATGPGGIHAHLALESNSGTFRDRLDPASVRLASSRQDCELVLLDAETTNLLRHRIATLAGYSERLSYAELADLAARCERELSGRAVRAAVVASSPEQLTTGLAALLRALAKDHGGRLAGGAPGPPGPLIDADAGVFLGGSATRSRIGYLFPGLSPGDDVVGGALTERFAEAREAYRTLGLPLPAEDAGPRGSGAATVAALRVLALLGIEAVTAAGPGQGELISLCWAGAMDPGALMELAAARERVTACVGDRVGAAAEFARLLRRHRFYRLSRPVVSTVTGEPLAADVDVPLLLARQVLEPPQAGPAVRQLAAQVDLLVEVGPGRRLSRLAAGTAPRVPTVSLELDQPSLAGVLGAVAAAYVLGAPVRHEQLFCGRLTRPLPQRMSTRSFAVS